MSKSTLPESSEDITAEFLTLALRSIPSMSDAVVDSCQVTRIGEGIGFTGQIFRAELEYASHLPDAPRTLVVKLPSADRTFREQIWHVYEKEFRFYEGIADGIEMRVPACYYCVRDPGAHRGVLLLEDFGFARAGDQVVGCSREDAERGAIGLGALHASRWSVGIDEPPDDGKSKALDARRRRLFPQWWTTFVGRFGHQVPDVAVAIGEELVHKTEELGERMEAAPTTFIHGDFRLDNLFFLEDGTVAAVDWQKYGNGRAIWDTGRFLVSSLDPSVPSQTTIELLSSYHASLRHHGACDYSLTQVQHDFRLSLLQMWLFVIRIAVLLDMSVNKRSEALLDREIAQIGQALVKHDAAAIMGELR